MLEVADGGIKLSYLKEYWKLSSYYYIVSFVISIIIERVEAL